MKKALTTGVLAMAIVTLFTSISAGPVAAAAPVPITIETTRQGPSGAFDVSGGFVDEGTFGVVDPKFGGPGPGRFVLVHATETFSGAAGTFTLRRDLRVTWGADPTVRTISGTWTVIAGTGAYEDLHGTGTLAGTVTGVPPTEVFVITYTGTIHNT